MLKLPIRCLMDVRDCSVLKNSHVPLHHVSSLQCLRAPWAIFGKHMIIEVKDIQDNNNNVNC